MIKNDNLLLYIKIIIFLDFFGVALVVPLMTSYFRDASISTKLLGFLSSMYSVSQIFGGIIMGILSDSLSKRDILLVSLFGSAISYLILGTSKNIGLLFFSRILVGLVKQSYTIATIVINEITDGRLELRSQELGRLSTLATVSFLVGPPLGSILYGSVSKSAPAQAAALCFLLNGTFCYIFIPQYGIMAMSKAKDDRKEVIPEDSKVKSSYISYLSNPFKTFMRQLSELASIPNVLAVIFMRLSIMFVESSMSSRHIVNYYESRFGIPTSSLGFMSTTTTGFSIKCSKIYYFLT
jgi:MFS family permease